MKSNSFLRNAVKTVAVLAVMALSSSAMAQTVQSGTYSGTLTITSTVFTLMDINQINTEITNQQLRIGEDDAAGYYLFFESIPILKVGEPVAIGFRNVPIAANGVISTSSMPGSFGDVALMMTIINGNVSGNTITLVFKGIDTGTNGTLVDVTFNYTGTVQTSGLADLSSEKDILKEEYFSLTGAKVTANSKSVLIKRTVYTDKTVNVQKIIKQ